MPPLSRIRTPVLLELVEQQRYTPSKALERQIDRAEGLAGEVDPSITYPEDWVVYRITGFRPDMEDPRMVPGEALRSDLSALVEHLSDRARLTRGSMGRRTMTLDEVCQRWSVSRKTIERYRRRGLVGRRVVEGEGGPTRLVFTRRAVEAFEAAHRGDVEAAGAFERMNEAERGEIVRRAGRYRARLGWTRNQIIGRLSTRTGRSRETIRRALEGEVEAGDRLSPEARRAIFEGEREGVAPGELARRFGRSRASIHRIVNVRRCEMLRRLDLSIPEELGEGAGRAWMEGALGREEARGGLGVEVILEASAWVGEARRAPAEPAEEERVRALAYHALRERARVAAEGMDRRTPPAGALDRAETDLRWAALLKRALVHAQRGLVVRTLEERAGRSLLELGGRELRGLHRAAHETVIGVVDRYRPVRGGRLAAPVSLALGRRLGHAPEGEAAGPGRATPLHERGGEGLWDWTGSLGAWQAWLDPPEGLWEVLEGLEGEARGVVEARFGLGGSAPMTLAEIESALGVGRRRARLLVRRAVRAGVRARGSG